MNITLPKTTKRIMDDYLSPMRPSFPKEIFLISLYSMVSRLLCFNRLQIKTRTDLRYPNLCLIIFGESSIGKDQSQKVVKRLYKKVLREQELACTSYQDSVETQVNKNLNNLDNKEFSSIQKNQYREKHIPRDLTELIEAGTPEGLAETRYAFSKAGFGATFYRNMEFTDLIVSKDNTSMRLQTMLKESFESASNSVSIIKGEKKAKKVKDVPQTILIATSLEDLNKNKEGEAFLQAWLSRGMARRAIISLPKPVDPATLPSIEEQNKLIDRALLIEEDLQSMILEIHKNTLPTEIPPIAPFHNSLLIPSIEMPTYKSQVIELTKEAQDYFDNYQRQSLIKAFNLTLFQGMTKYEITDRPWRILDWSCCLALLEHPNNLVITKEDFIYAQNIVEYFSKQFHKVLQQPQITDTEIIYDFILQNQDERVVKKTELRKLIKGRNDYKTRKLEEALVELEEVAEERGKVLKPKIEGIKISYRLEDIIEIDPVLAEVEVEDLPKAIFSYSDDKDHHYTYNYEKYEMDFVDVADIITKYGYVAHSFLGGHRNNPNTVLCGNMLILDIDNKTGEGQLTMEQAKEKFKHFACIIAPSKNHQKAKNAGTAEEEPAVDRFRLIILCSSPIIPKNDYKHVIKCCLDGLELRGIADEKATPKKAQYYHPSPVSDELFISDGKKLFDWSIYDIEEIKKAPVVTYKNNGSDDLSEIKNIPITDLVERMGAKFNKKTSDIAFYFCPFHTSVSGTSFRIYLNDNNWTCVGCAGRNGNDAGGTTIDLILQWKGWGVERNYDAIRILKKYLKTNSLN